MPGNTTEQIEHWIKRLHEGDPAARDKLLSITMNRINYLIKALTASAGPALRQRNDTILQETYVKLLTKWNSIAGDGSKLGPIDSPRKYFYRASRVIKDVIVEVLRRQKTQISLGSRDPVCKSSDEVEFWLTIYDQLKLLPNYLREIFELRHFHALPHQEIADLLGIGESTSRKRWAEVRMILAESLSDGDSRLLDD